MGAVIVSRFKKEIGYRVGSLRFRWHLARQAAKPLALTPPHRERGPVKVPFWPEASTVWDRLRILWALGRGLLAFPPVGSPAPRGIGQHSQAETPKAPTQPTAIFVESGEDLSQLRTCLEGLRRYANVPFSLFLFGGGGLPELEPWLREHFQDAFDWKILGGEGGSALAAAIGEVSEEYIVFLRPDVIVTPPCLGRLQEAIRQDESIAGAVALSNDARENWIRMNPGDSIFTCAARLEILGKEVVEDSTARDPGCAMFSAEVLKTVAMPFGDLATTREVVSSVLDRFEAKDLRVVCAGSAFAYRGMGQPSDAPEPASVPQPELNRLRVRSAIERNPNRYAIDEICRATPRSPFHFLMSSQADRSYRGLLKRLPPRLALDEGRPLRVTFVVNLWEQVGGVLSIAQLVNDLVLEGVGVQLVVLDWTRFDKSIDLLVEPIVFRNREEAIRNFPISDIVVGTLWVTMYTIMEVYRRRRDFVPAYFVQDFEPRFYTGEQSWLQPYVSATYQFTDHCFSKTGWIAEQVREAGGTVTLIPPGLDLDLFHPRAVEKGTKKIVLAMLRPETPRRGFELTVATMRMLHENRDDIELHAFGSGDAALTETALGFPLVNHGVVPNHNLPELYSRATVFLECSEYHGFGRTVAEAMACGTACVISDSGGVGSFAWDGQNCHMVSSREPEAFFSAVEALLDNSDIRTEMEREARLAVLPMDRYRSARETLAYLEHCVAATAEGP